MYIYSPICRGSFVCTTSFWQPWGNKDVASRTQWTWVWVDSGSWWWTGKPGVCSSWGRKESDTTERLNWTDMVNGSSYLLFKFKRFSSVQFSRSVVSDSVTPWIAARQTSLSITNSRSSLRITSIESVMPSSHLILCRPLLLLPPIPPSIRVFSNESTLHMRWPKYWSFSFSISPSNEHPGPICFRMDWLDLYNPAKFI